VSILLKRDTKILICAKVLKIHFGEMFAKKNIFTPKIICCITLKGYIVMHV
jgi:hypothetical protein